MKSPYDFDLPIEYVFTLVKDCVAFTQSGGTPFTPRKSVISTFNTAQRIGMYTDNCKVWKRLVPALKIWAFVKTHFTRAHKKIRKYDAATRNVCFHTNTKSSQRKTVESISKLANIIISNRQSMALLILTVARLTVELAETNTKLVKVPATNTKLQANLTTSHNKNGGGSGGGGGNGGIHFPRAYITLTHY